MEATATVESDFLTINMETVDSLRDDEDQEPQEELEELDGLDNELFIEEISRHPAIWARGTSAFKDKNIKANAWKSVISNLKLEKVEAKTPGCVSKHWRHIKDGQARIMRDNARRSGQAAAVQKTYKYHSQLEFLRPYLLKNGTATNVSQTVQQRAQPSQPRQADMANQPHLATEPNQAAQMQDVSQPNQEAEAPVTGPSNTVHVPEDLGRRKRPRTAAQQLAKTLSTYLEQKAANPSAKPKDDVDTWLDSLKPGLRRLTPFKQAILVLKFQRMLAQTEFGKTSVDEGMEEDVDMSDLVGIEDFMQ